MSLLLLAGCGDKAPEPGDDAETTTAVAPPTDADGDGYTALSDGGDDCDDGDASVHPGAVDDWYDGVDSDCAGDDDHDADRDGFASAEYGGDDCDDGNPVRSPVAVEDCGDGIENDCDGLLDCEDADCATDAMCSEDCSNELDDDGDGLVDCEQPECLGTTDCPIYEVALHGGSMTLVDEVGAFSQAQEVRARDVSGQVIARTVSGGTTSCAFGSMSGSWRASFTSYFWPVAFTGSVSSACGADLRELFPTGMRRSGAGFLGYHFFSAGPWGSSSAVRSSESGWFAGRTLLGTQDFRVPGTYWALSGQQWFTYSLTGETHLLLHGR